jgi:hypothetical protein
LIKFKLVPIAVHFKDKQKKRTNLIYLKKLLYE